MHTAQDQWWWAGRAPVCLSFPSATSPTPGLLGGRGLVAPSPTPVFHLHGRLTKRPLDPKQNHVQPTPFAVPSAPSAPVPCKLMDTRPHESDQPLPPSHPPRWHLGMEWLRSLTDCGLVFLFNRFGLICTKLLKNIQIVRCPPTHPRVLSRLPPALPTEAELRNQTAGPESPCPKAQRLGCAPNFHCCQHLSSPID